MSVYNWSCFTKRINVRATSDVLYNAWATRSGIEKWFLRLSEFRKPDGSLRNNDEEVQKGDSY
ncbi:MAG: hypothetical protein M3O67_06455, partial [Bacteroidota bacterium]|nr:hypothetical protein [Bacteroidota bacterium]